MKHLKLSNAMTWQTNTLAPTLTKLEYFALIIGAHQHETYRDLWADNAIERAQLLIAELDKVQAQEVQP